MTRGTLNGAVRCTIQAPTRLEECGLSEFGGCSVVVCLCVGLSILELRSSGNNQPQTRAHVVYVYIYIYIYIYILLLDIGIPVRLLNPRTEEHLSAHLLKDNAAQSCIACQQPYFG